MYICDLTRASGAGRAMCLNTRGLVRSVIRLIVPPLPALSTPSNTTQTLAPVALTHSCMATSPPWRIRISRSYSFRFIFLEGPASCGFFVALLIARSPDRSSQHSDQSFTKVPHGCKRRPGAFARASMPSLGRDGVTRCP